MEKGLQINDIKVPSLLVEKFDKLGISNDEASSLMSSFGLPLVEAGPLLDTYKDILVTDELDIVTMKLARETRLKLSKIRCSVENTRKDLKSEFLRKGDAIQAVANYIKENIEPAEQYLELQEKFAEIKMAERLAKTKLERTEKLLRYTDDISIYNINNLQDETFDILLAKVKKEYDDKIAAEKVEAERLAKEETDRIAEQERIVAENARLRKEAEEKEVALAVERKKEADKQAKLDAERQKELLAERAKVEAERAKIAAIEAEQRKKDELAAKEKADKEAIETKAIADAKQAEMDALLSPDKDKLLNFVRCLELIKDTKLPAVKTKQAQDVVNAIDGMLIDMIIMVEKKANEL